MKALLKNLIYSSLVLFSFSNCTEDLTLTPISQITNSSFWQSPEEAEGALNGMYVRMRTQATSNLFIWGEGRSEIWVQNFGFDPSVNFHVFTNNLSNINAGPDWTTMYSVIHDANLILKYVPDIDFVSESEKSNILAQAHAMRAFVYFTMTKTWGDLILIEEPTEGFDPITIYRERSSQSEIFSLIKRDIESALSLFSGNTFPAGRNRWSMPAVNALKADVFLWTGKRLNGGSADFNTALTAISQIEASNVELLVDYHSIFDFNNKGNNEIIMAVRFQEGESPTRTVYGGITALVAPTFPFTDMETIEKVEPFSGKNPYWQVAPSVATQFNEDDSRKEGNLIQVYQTREGVTSFMYNTDLKWPGLISGGVRVMFDDFIIYRYGDIVLMKAEAKNALDQDPSEEINKIRARAYGDNFDDHVFVNGSKEENDEAILQERLFELLHEGKRWWDLVRFGKAFEKVPLLQGGSEHQLLFPIHEDILSLEPLVEQNPGY
ncbi:MAG: RagB/SusD family nutrient uptake outer membrane protein [Cyclobacteriaceae bacterium]